MKKGNGNSRKTQEQIASRNLETKALLTVDFGKAGKRKAGRPKKIKIKKVIKSDGTYEAFSLRKIERSVLYAGRDTKEYGKKETQKIIAKIKRLLGQVRSKVISTKEIRNLVEPVLAQEGYSLSLLIISLTISPLTIFIT